MLRTPRIEWKVGDLPVIAKRLIGHADNSACPEIKVDIKMAVVTPKDAKGRVPVLMMFGSGAMPNDPAPNFGGGAGRGGNAGPSDPPPLPSFPLSNGSSW